MTATQIYMMSIFLFSLATLILSGFADMLITMGVGMLAYAIIKAVYDEAYS